MENNDPVSEKFFNTTKGKFILEELKNTYDHISLRKIESKYFLDSPLGKALLELERKGFYIRMQCGENSSDGRYKMENLSNHNYPYIFFNRLEFMELLQKGGTYLHFGGSKPDYYKNKCFACDQKLKIPEISNKGEVLHPDLKFIIRYQIESYFQESKTSRAGEWYKKKLKKPICPIHGYEDNRIGLLIVETFRNHGIESDLDICHVHFELEKNYKDYFSCFDLIYTSNVHLFSNSLEELIFIFLGNYIREDELIAEVSNNKNIGDKIYKLFNNLFNQKFENFYQFFVDLLLRENWEKFDNDWVTYSDIKNEERRKYINDLNTWEKTYSSIYSIFNEKSIQRRINKILSYKVSEDDKKADKLKKML